MRLDEDESVILGISFGKQTDSLKVCLTFDPPSAGPPLESAPQPEAGHVGAAGAAVGAGGRDPGQTARAGGAAAGQGLGARLRKVLVCAPAPRGRAPRGSTPKGSHRLPITGKTQA